MSYLKMQMRGDRLMNAIVFLYTISISVYLFLMQVLKGHSMKTKESTFGTHKKEIYFVQCVFSL